jgi:hypothetical protein
MANKYKHLAHQKRKCRVVAKGKGRCHYCKWLVSTKKEDVRSPLYATRDHQIPLSKGGKNSMSNIVLCCRECNEKKGNMMPGEFWRRLHWSEINYEAAFKKDCFADAALAFCRECLGWGEGAAYAGENRIVNGSSLQVDFKFASPRAAMRTVLGWCDENDAMLETSYYKGTNMARVRLQKDSLDGDNGEWQESENLMQAIFWACVEAARKKTATTANARGLALGDEALRRH